MSDSFRAAPEIQNSISMVAALLRGTSPEILQLEYYKQAANALHHTEITGESYCR